MGTHSDTGMESLRVSLTLGLISLAAGQEVTIPTIPTIGPPRCFPNENCTRQFRGLGECVNMKFVNVTTLAKDFDLKAGSVDGVCTQPDNFDCCRCLKMKDCTWTRECRVKRGKCYKKGQEPFWAVMLKATSKAFLSLTKVASDPSYLSGWWIPC